MSKTKVLSAIEDMGGFGAFAAKLGHRSNAISFRLIAEGKRIPSARVRRLMAENSGGRFTEQDIIAITGRTEPRRTPPPSERESNIWGLPESERRIKLAKQTALKAKQTREAMSQK